MKRIDLIFLTLAAASLVVGVSMGLYMGLKHDFALTPIHVHVNLVGWTSLALYGLTYRAYPALQRGWVAYAHLAIAGSSGVAFPLGLYLALFQEQGALLPPAALLWVLGAIVFLARLVMLWFKDEPQAA
jgi:hypothetical protein